MSEEQADTIVILSTELIAKIVEEYFNRTMFKQKVSVVDSGPHGSAGYMFGVVFNESKKGEVKVREITQDNVIIAPTDIEALLDNVKRAQYIGKVNSLQIQEVASGNS